MVKATASLWQRERFDEVPAYGLVITDTGENIKYVPERTCKMIPFIEDDDSIFIVNCSECGDAIFARGGDHDCNYCPSCGGRVEGE